MNHIDYKDFLNVDIRVGTIIDVQSFNEARNPSFKVWVDFGDTIGIKKTSAQITTHYTFDDLIGMQILGVVNFPPKQIANFMSEFLILGVSDNHNNIILMTPTKTSPNGARLH